MNLMINTIMRLFELFEGYRPLPPELANYYVLINGNRWKVDFQTHQLAAEAVENFLNNHPKLRGRVRIDILPIKK